MKYTNKYLNFFCVLFVGLLVMPQVAFATMPVSSIVEKEAKMVRIESPRAGTLNVRKVAGAKNVKVDVVKHGARYSVLEEKKVGQEIWYKVEYAKGKTGWISAKFTKEEKISKAVVPKKNMETNNDQQKPQIQNSQPVAVETWAQQETRDFAYADARGWTSLISTNSFGEKRYYRKEGSQWIQKNSEAEAIRPSAPIETWGELESKYFKEATQKGWYSLIITNALGEKRYYYYLNRFGWSQAENEQEMEELAKASIGITEYEAGIDRSRQIKENLDLAWLEYKLNKPAPNNYSQSINLNNDKLTQPNNLYNEPTFAPPTISAPSLKPLHVPQIQNSSWSIQWTGGGAGFIQDSSGKTTNFQCDSLLGRCFSL